MQICIVLTLIVTMYVPGAGGINGGLRGGYDRVNEKWIGGVLLNNTHAACGFSYRFGTTFEVIDDSAKAFLEDDGQPVKRVCFDRGGAVRAENLDLVSDSISLARKWGRRLVPVRICQSQILTEPDSNTSKYQKRHLASYTPQ